MTIPPPNPWVRKPMDRYRHKMLGLPLHHLLPAASHLRNLQTHQPRLSPFHRQVPQMQQQLLFRCHLSFPGRETIPRNPYLWPLIFRNQSPWHVVEGHLLPPIPPRAAAFSIISPSYIRSRDLHSIHEIFRMSRWILSSWTTWIFCRRLVPCTMVMAILVAQTT